MPPQPLMLFSLTDKGKINLDKTPKTGRSFNCLGVLVIEKRSKPALINKTENSFFVYVLASLFFKSSVCHSPSVFASSHRLI